MPINYTNGSVDPTILEQFFDRLAEGHGSEENAPLGAPLQVAHRKLREAPSELVTPNRWWARRVAAAAVYLSSNGRDTDRAAEVEILSRPSGRYQVNFNDAGKEVGS